MASSRQKVIINEFKFWCFTENNDEHFTWNLETFQGRKNQCYITTAAFLIQKKNLFETEKVLYTAAIDVSVKFENYFDIIFHLLLCISRQVGR